MFNIVHIQGGHQSGKSVLVHHAMVGFAQDKTVLLVTDTERIFPLPSLVTHLQISPDTELPLSQIRGHNFDVVFVDVNWNEWSFASTDAVMSACSSTLPRNGTMYIVDHTR